MKNTISVNYSPLFQILKEKNMQLDDLKKLGVSYSTIQNINSNKDIRVTTLCRIAAFLKCSIADIISYDKVAV